MRKPKSLQPNRSIKTLRAVLEKTQQEFALLLGVSKDTVISWENGRLAVTAEKASRISFLTGAIANDLRRGRGTVRADPAVESDWIDRSKPYSPHDYTLQDYKTWTTRMNVPGKVVSVAMGALTEYLLQCLCAAAQHDSTEARVKLPAICLRFVDEIMEVRDSFNLEARIQHMLKSSPDWTESGKCSQLTKQIRELISKQLG